MQTQTDVGEQWQEPQLGNYACCGKPLKVGYRHCTICHMYWRIDGIHTCCQFTADDYTELYKTVASVFEVYDADALDACSETSIRMRLLWDIFSELPKP